MEENRRFSLTDLFIKVILVILFVLFTVWLLSLSNKDISGTLDVIADNIFADNVDRMKEAGKSYFTTERLPKKIGEIETITLEEMYKKKLLLEIKDKNGNACDAEDSYVSVEKMENEYQMKINLECGEEEDYIIVIMGCYNYCDTDICEKQEEVKEIEYEYKKTTGGKWTDYGKWSEWSKVSVTNTNYRQVETKKELEEYTYDKVVTETLYEEIQASCPAGYTKTSDGTRCYKTTTTYEYADPVCPTVSGYTLTGRNGFTCNYSKTTTSTADPVCPTLDGWNYVSRNGFTCNYSRSVTSTTEYDKVYVETRTGSYVPADNDTYVYEQIDADYVYSCNSTCSMRWIYTYKVYKKVYKPSSETKTANASCPSGYTQSGTTCVKSTTSYETKTASCPSGYSKSENKCAKAVQNYSYEDLIKSCPTDGYKLNSDGTKCYINVEKTIKVTGTKEVTYYRYRVREYIGGTVDYKWSKSKNDKDLLNAGYVLTGRTR